jgi:hypothetical protein
MSFEIPLGSADLVELELEEVMFALFESERFYFAMFKASLEGAVRGVFCAVKRPSVRSYECPQIFRIIQSFRLHARTFSFFPLLPSTSTIAMRVSWRFRSLLGKALTFVPIPVEPPEEQ